MLRSWIDAGFAPSEFWSATPRYIQTCLQGAAQRLDRELFLVEKLAWDNASLCMKAYHEPKSFPDFKRYAHTPGRPAARRALSGDDVVSIIAAAVGRPVERLN